MENDIRNIMGGIVERVSDSEMYMIFASLISSDNLTSLGKCEESMMIADAFADAIRESGISDMRKRKFMEYAEKTKSVISGDIVKFKKEKYA